WGDLRAYEQAKELSDGELVEIANSNDQPSALKANVGFHRKEVDFMFGRTAFAEKLSYYCGRFASKYALKTP
ncbi:hypothetical protein, partial [Mesorhizobium escarrei]|uniref:hypothetical protein n=1 Tax=Mesorhizobium escarrei TaxID=666018 RepID=UPI0020A73804